MSRAPDNASSADEAASSPLSLRQRFSTAGHANMRRRKHLGMGTALLRGPNQRSRHRTALAKSWHLFTQPAACRADTACTQRGAFANRCDPQAGQRGRRC
jgi:hypothetical protein